MLDLRVYSYAPVPLYLLKIYREHETFKFVEKIKYHKDTNTVQIQNNDKTDNVVDNITFLAFVHYRMMMMKISIYRGNFGYVHNDTRFRSVYNV